MSVLSTGYEPVYMYSPSPYADANYNHLSLYWNTLPMPLAVVLMVI